MKRVNQREVIDSSFHSPMAYPMLKLAIVLIISLSDLLRAVIEFFIEYKDVLLTKD